MTFRTRLLLVFAVTIVAAVGLVVWIVSASTQRAFEQLDRERTAALVQQFQKEFEQRGEDVARAADRIAKDDATVRIAIDMNRPDPELSLHVDDAQALAAAHGLDFLELVGTAGAIVSSAQWPARFGYKETWLTEPVDWNAQPPFLKREDLPDEAALALEAVRVRTAGDWRLYVVAGRRLDATFLATPRASVGHAGRALPQSRSGLFAGGAVRRSNAEAMRFAPLIERVMRENREVATEIRWRSDPASAETFQAIPLDDRDGRPLGVLLIGSSRRE